MSIATEEAAKLPILANIYKKADLDHNVITFKGANDVAEAAYIAGRTAEPTEAEIDASAFAQFKAANNNSSWRLTEEQYREAWDALPAMVSDDFIRKARIGLTAARKAVTE